MILTLEMAHLHMKSERVAFLAISSEQDHHLHAINLILGKRREAKITKVKHASKHGKHWNVAF